MISPAKPRPCATCPWRTANHGKPHPDGWYTKRNRARLWAQLRRGEMMSCHKTDPANPVPSGVKPVPYGTEVHECAGALVLQQREIMNFQRCKSLPLYRSQHPNGLLRAGLLTIAERAVFGGMSGLVMARPDLNEPVSHDRLHWNPDVTVPPEK